MNELKFKISFEVFRILGQLISLPKSQISPISGDTQLTNQDVAELVSLGIVDNNRNLSPNFEHMLYVLTCAEAFGRIKLGGGDLHDYTLFFDPKGGSSVSVKLSSDGFILEDPADGNLAIQSLGQYTGESIIQTIDFNEELPVNEAYVLATYMDLRRRDLLRQLANGWESEVFPYDASVIMAAIGTEPDPANTLLNTVAVKSPLSDSLSDVHVSEAINSLVNKKLLSIKDGGFILTEGASRAAERLLLIDNIITVSAGKVTSKGRVVVVGLTCLQSGVNDLMTIEANENSIEFEGISSARLISMMDYFLSNSQALDSVIPFETKPLGSKNEADVAGTPKFCTDCGAKLLDDSKFCTSCGKKIN